MKTTRKQIDTPRRGGPGPYIRGAHGIENPTADQVQEYIASHAVPYGYNRAARRRMAWQHRTVKGQADLRAIQQAGALHMLPVGVQR